MANDVRIGVTAETGRTTAGLREIEQSTRRVADAVKGIDQASRGASAGLGRIEVSAKRLEQVARLLSREFNRAVDPAQAEKFLQNFEAMRTSRAVSGASKIRHFGSFEEWLAGNERLFVDPKEAERYRRRVLAFAAQGTGMPDLPRAAGADSPSQSWFERNQRQFGRQAIGIGRAALGLAGIMGVMAMAGRAVDLARDEAVANDQLLRSVGDLHQEFEALRAQVRESGRGLGVAFGEAAAMAKTFASVANATADTDIYGNLRTGFGLSRAYGMDLATGVGFMAQARLYGAIGSDDTNGRRFALMIAEAIERGGVTAKADEVLAAVGNFTSTLAKATLTAPNVAGFAGALAALTSSGTVGLDPSGAANLLMAADASMRRGGGMGEAGLNFTYGALSRGSPGLHPILALATAEQGLFGSGADLANSPLGRFMAERGGLPTLSGESNLSLVMDEIRRQYSDPLMQLDAIKNYFNLGSYQHAAAFASMDPLQLGGLGALLGRLDIDPATLKASGIQNLAEVAGAGRAELEAIAQRQLARTDVPLTLPERERLEGAMASGDTEELRAELARILATREQEKNIGTETRDAVVDLKNLLTEIGNGLLPAVTSIQRSVVAIAKKVATDSDYVQQLQLQEGYSEYKRDREGYRAELDAKLKERREKMASRGLSEYAINKRMQEFERGAEWDWQRFLKKNQQFEEMYQQELEERANSGRGQSGAQLQEGGALPRGNPAGSPSRDTRMTITVDGLMRDRKTGEPVADIASPPTTISLPAAAGM